MTDLAALSRELLAAAEHKPTHLQPWLKNIANNLAIMASDDTKTLPEQREAAQRELVLNIGRYERAKSKTHPAE